MYLPPSGKLDTVHLQRLFDNKSECYKLFWFKAIIDSVFNGETVLKYDDLINMMIAEAWYMVTEYKLNLGPKDTLEEIIKYTQDLTSLISSTKKEKLINEISKITDREFVSKKRTLTNNVPYRLQSPYLDGFNWNKYKSQKILADQINTYSGLIYTFVTLDGLNSTIKIDDNWAEYIKDNYQILDGWIKFDMINYLQKRNPGVPGIPNKLSPPEERDLKAVHDYWKEVSLVIPIIDIYSNQTIEIPQMTIDHFVPWSYVAHDELWNLCPTVRSINSSKSNSLPDWSNYFSRLQDFEFDVYKVTFSNTKLINSLEKCSKKHVNNDDIIQKLYKPGLTETEFKTNLEDIITPVYKNAENLGFGVWQYVDP